VFQYCVSLLLTVAHLASIPVITLIEFILRGIKHLSFSWKVLCFRRTWLKVELTSCCVYQLISFGLHIFYLTVDVVLKSRTQINWVTETHWLKDAYHECLKRWNMLETWLEIQHSFNQIPEQWHLFAVWIQAWYFLIRPHVVPLCI
jgi:hypothetical protein